ncbi:MAG: S8 family serine peptidase [Pararhodobacter sp.]
MSDFAARPPPEPGRALRGRAGIMHWLVSALCMLLWAGSAAAQQPTGPTGPTTGDFSGRPVQSSPNVARTQGWRVEHVIAGPLAQAGAMIDVVQDAGGEAIRRRDLPALRQVLLVALFPTDAARDAAVNRLAQAAPASSLDLHHLYRFAQSAPRLYAPVLIGDPAPGACRLGRSIALGMIDGPVNTDHPALRGARVRAESLIERGRVPPADHGTAVAALLVGEAAASGLGGFAIGGELHAMAVFTLRDRVEETTVELVAMALDRLIGRNVRLINMSFAGPENAAFARILAAAAQRGAVLVAASGNDAARRVAYPAAAPDVIAVTAIDAARRRYPRANTGAQIEFAAPGVDLYAARAGGAGYVSGTSYAAPIVTGLAARLMARGAGSAQAVRAGLRASAQNLGGGRNPETGWGLVRTSGC